MEERTLPLIVVPHAVLNIPILFFAYCNLSFEKYANVGHQVFMRNILIIG